jgi:DeoR/GlpR family transcriptional regulator of sugar metabolism
MDVHVVQSELHRATKARSAKLQRRKKAAFDLRIIVADITKIGTESFCHIGPITIADVLVTNETSDPDKLRLLQEIEKAGVIVKFARM